MPRWSKSIGVANRGTNTSGTPFRWSWLLSALVLLLALHPIAAADFWWQLARGRAVWEGHLAPSRELLVFEPYGDADWLSGLPWYLIHLLAGPAMLSIGTAVAAVILANLIGRWSAPALNHHFRIILIFLGFATARLSWSPTPTMADILGVIAIWFVAGRLVETGRRWTLAQLVLCELLWTSFGTIPLLGLLLALIRMNSENQLPAHPIGFRTQAVILILMAFAGSASPRGYLTLWDSLRLMFPWTCTDLGTLEAAGMLPQLRWPLTSELAAFAVLGLINLFLLIRNVWTDQSTGWRGVAIVILATVIAMSSSANIGAAAFLLMLGTIGLAQTLAHRVELRESEKPASRQNLKIWPDVISAGVLTSAAIAIGGGFWPGSQLRLGWGLTPLLEPSLIEALLSDLKLEGSCYCSGVREAGYLAWYRPGSIRPSDSPPRALLSGRLKDHVRIGWDLAHGWRDKHRRSDGTWGGWLTPLREQRTRLLLISSDQYAIIRALESSPWKPLSIDATSIPYGFEGDPALTVRIKKVRWLLDLVDLGEWTYPPPAASGGGSTFDLIGWSTDRHDLRNDLRQSKTLVAMRRYYAGLKVLKYGLQRSDPESREEFREIQLEMANREYLAVGQASSWRLLAYLQTGGDPMISQRLNPMCVSLCHSLPEGFTTALAAYARHDLEAAKKTLSPQFPESTCGMVQIALEQGNATEAARWIRYLKATFPNSTETKAILHVVPLLPE